MVIIMMFLDGCQHNSVSDKISDKGDKILDKMVGLAKDLDVKEDLSLCFLYSYLLYTGNLSVKRNFTYDINNIYNNGFYQIMLGYGCCRNIEDGLYKFLNRYDFTINMLDVNTNIFSTKPNHCVNMIISSDGYFIFDVTNMKLKKIYNHLLKSVKKRGIHLQKIIKPELRLTESVFMYYDLNEEQRHFKYNLEEYLERKKTDMEYFRKNSDAFNGFYDDAKDDIKEVSSLILKQKLLI